MRWLVAAIILYLLVMGLWPKYLAFASQANTPIATNAPSGQKGLGIIEISR